MSLFHFMKFFILLFTSFLVHNCAVLNGRMLAMPSHHVPWVNKKKLKYRKTSRLKLHLYIMEQKARTQQLSTLIHTNTKHTSPNLMWRFLLLFCFVVPISKWLSTEFVFISRLFFVPTDCVLVAYHSTMTLLALIHIERIQLAESVGRLLILLH